MSTFKPDAGITLLTEIIDAPALDDQVSTASPPASSVPTAPAVPPPPSQSAPFDTEHWERLEHELRERVLQQVLKRIDLALEQRVRDSLADVLQIAVEGLAAEIRAGLHQTVKDVVTRAVMQEIDASRISRK